MMAKGIYAWPSSMTVAVTDVVGENVIVIRLLAPFTAVMSNGPITLRVPLVTVIGSSAMG